MKNFFSLISKSWTRFSDANAGRLAETFSNDVIFPQKLSVCLRKRVFTPVKTFWLFLSQIFSADGSCKETVIKNIDFLSVNHEYVSQNPAAYCKARAKLSVKLIRHIMNYMIERFKDNYSSRSLWHGRDVKVADGSSINMPDTEENQIIFPQIKEQKPGCGFPIARIVVIFSLFSGIILNWQMDAFNVSEWVLFRQMWDFLNEYDIILSDRGFYSYSAIYCLSLKKVDCVMRSREHLRKNIEIIEKITKGDNIVLWFKSKMRPAWMDEKTWKQMPSQIKLRQISYRIEQKGFRTEFVVLITTLIDHKKYPAKDICELYLTRWKAELYLRDIKTTMGMEMLSTMTPKMAIKEVSMFFIAYNLVRISIYNAARIYNDDLYRISFKGALRRIENFFRKIQNQNEDEINALYNHLLLQIRQDKNKERKNRMEPRVIKRRPKHYPLLPVNRHIYKNTRQRGKITKTLS